MVGSLRALVWGLLGCLSIGTVSASTLLDEGFEGGALPSGWSISNGVWEIGIPSTGPGSALAGISSVGTVLGGNYPANTNSRLITSDLALPALAGSEELWLRFEQFSGYGSGSSGSVEVQTFNSGAGTWGPWVAQATTATWSSPQTTTAVDLTPHAGTTIRIAFSHVASANVGPGWYLDEVTVCVTDPCQGPVLPTGWSGWYATNGVWEVGIPTAGPTASLSGAAVAGTILDGNYPRFPNSRWVSPTLCLPLLNDPTEELWLRYWQWFRYEGGDSGFVQIQVRDQATGVWGAWQDAPIASTASLYSTQWTRAGIELTQHAGEAVRVSFVHAEDNDTGLDVGWYVDDLEFWQGVPTFNMLESFDNGPGDWWVENGVWKFGVPTQGPNPLSGTDVVATMLDGNYPRFTNSRLVSPTFAIDPLATADEEVWLRFWSWFRYEGGDLGFFQIRVQDPATGVWSAWQDLLLTSKAELYSPMWTRAAVELTEYAGETVRVSFVHTEDNDTGLDLGWYVEDLEFWRGVPTFHPAEPFETGPGDWWTENGVWEFGAPTQGPGNALNGTGVVATVLDANYPRFTNSRLVSPTFTIDPLATPNEEVWLRFWHWFRYEGGDVGFFQIRVQDPATGLWGAWEDLTITSKGELYSPLWTRAAAELTQYAGEKVRISFVHTEDNDTGLDTGWFVDDLEFWRGVPSFNLAEPFDSGPGDWWIENGVWQFGSPTQGPGSPLNGSGLVATQLDANYPRFTNSRLVSPTFTIDPLVTPNEEVWLRFWNWFRYEGGDIGFFQIRVQDPTNALWGPWQDLTITSKAELYSPMWTRAAAELTGYAGETVRIAFVHTEDNDTGLDTGWFVDDLEFWRGIPSFADTEDFASGPGDWWAENGLWQVGAPSAGPLGGHDCSPPAGTVLDGQYPRFSNSRFVSPTYEVPAVGPSGVLELRYWQWTNYEGGDAGDLQIRERDPSGIWMGWQPLAAQVAVGTSDWTFTTVDLTAYAGKVVRLGFVHTDDNDTGLGQGWFIDGIRVDPEHEGFVRGDANSDAAFNTADVIFTLAYLFTSGNSPTCLQTMDVNDDESVNLSDAISMLGYLFSGGAAPADPFVCCGPDPTPGPLDCIDFDVCP